MFDSILKYFGGGDEGKGWQGILAAALGLGAGYDSYKEAKEAQDAFRKRPTSGYQGVIPEYTAYRERVPVSDINRRPGSSGRRYFTDMEFVGTPEYVVPTIPEGASDETIADLNEQARADQQAGLDALLKGVRERAQTQKTDLAAANLGNPYRQVNAPYATTPVAATPTNITPTYQPTASNDIYDVLNRLVERSKITPYGTTTTVSDTQDVVQAAGGGLMGTYLAGKTDGMADQIPARIDNRQEARLSDGEYVVPADAVSHLGNGNSDAGAEVLKNMIARVRKERTGNPNQGKEINPNKILPA